MDLQAVLFDLDDTLTDRPRSLRVYARRFAADFHDVLGRTSDEDLFRAISQADRGGYTPKDVVAAELLRTLPWRAEPTPGVLRAHWSAHFPDCAQPADGAGQVLDDLAARGLPIGVVTNGGSQAQRAKIERLGIGPRLQVLLISEEVGVKKPDGRIFQQALDGLGVSGEGVWFVGDHPVNDVAGARGARLRTVWLAHGRAWPAELLPPDVSIAHLSDLTGALRRH